MALDATSQIPSTGIQSSSLQTSTSQPGEFDALLKRGLNFWPLLRTIKRKALLITGLTVLLTGLAVVKTKQDPLLYQGSFELLVEPITSQGQLADPTTLARGLQDALDVLVAECASNKDCPVSYTHLTLPTTSRV